MTVSSNETGVVVHLESMFEELAPVHAAGISTEGRLLLSDRAHLLFDFHKLVDGMLESRLSKDGSSIGTTKKGKPYCTWLASITTQRDLQVLAPRMRPR